MRFADAVSHRLAPIFAIFDPFSVRTWLERFIRFLKPDANLLLALLAHAIVAILRPIFARPPEGSRGKCAVVWTSKSKFLEHAPVCFRQQLRLRDVPLPIRKQAYRSFCDVIWIWVVWIAAVQRIINRLDEEWPNFGQFRAKCCNILILKVQEFHEFIIKIDNCARFYDFAIHF